MLSFVITFHGFVIVVVMIIIVLFQYYFYAENKKCWINYLLIFPVDVMKDAAVIKKGNNIQELETKYKNKIWRIIIDSINKYLLSNHGSVSDYHIIKDIVDRNCDAQEDEINTQIPLPLYLGLVGTMIGILIGIAFLVFTGDLKSLLGSGVENGFEGVEALIGGVAIAMISSINGIVLTTLGMIRVKTVKVIVERNKNEFLSWIQAKLLPELSNEMTGVLRIMTKDLTDFNKTFALNNAQFASSLSKVVEASDKNAELIKLIIQLQDKKITTKNLELLNVLEKWVSNFQNIKDFNDSLWNKLEEVGKYFKAEREQLERRKTLLAEAFNKMDLNSNAALKGFNENLSASLQKIQETYESTISDQGDTLKKQQDIIRAALDTQNNALIQSITAQRTVFSEKLKDIPKIIDELNSIGDKISSITRFEQAIKEQNGKFDQLILAINEFAKAKNKSEYKFVAESLNFPVWQKRVVFAALILSVIYFLIEIVVKAFVLSGGVL